MSLTILLVLLAAGALIIPSLGGDDDEETGKNEIDGTFEDDNPLDGTEGNDLIRGFLGDDTIDGKGGNDEILGGDGNDTLIGGGGLDFIRGGSGNDTIDGGEGNDRLIADRGNDTIDGGFGSDIIRGGQGDDIIFGGFDSRLQDDGSVVGNVSATDQINGEEGDDTIFIWGGDSVANGGENDDTVVLMTGNGTFLDGGGSNDFYAFGNLTDDQDTTVTIEDFDRTLDTLTLTVDTSGLETGDDIDYSVVIQNATQDGLPGVRITIDIEETTDAAGNSFEAASAFIVGIDEEDIDPDDIKVVFTDNADLFDAQASLADVRAGGISLA